MNMATESDYTTTAERVAVPQNKVSKHINEEFKCPLYTNVKYSISATKRRKKTKRYFIQAFKARLNILL